MSLYIGKLSPRTRKDELEHIFRRFGCCEVRLKDGYGFVVYDFSPNAEKALRALQGRNICGQPLTLTWSNKQPKNFQRYARGATSFESRGRNSASRKFPNDWRDHRSGIRQPDRNGRMLNSEDMFDEDRDYYQENMKDYIEDERHSFREEFQSDAGHAVSKMVDNGRWGDQHDDQSIENGVDNGMMFDRYDDESRWMANTGGSALRSSQENLGRERNSERLLNHPSSSKSQQTCYSCGALGHKMRDCPRKHSSKSKVTRFDRGPDDDINKNRVNDELERFESMSQEKLQSSRTPTLKYRNDRREESDSGKLRISINSENCPETDRAQGKERGGKERSGRKTGSSRRNGAKKIRMSASTSRSRSISASKSSKSLAMSISRPRSRSISEARSLSSNSKSRSKSCPKSRWFKSRSRSSSPASLSLSVSLGQLPSTHGNAELNNKVSLDNAAPVPKDSLLEQRQPEEGSAKVAPGKEAVSGKIAVSTSEVEVDMEKSQPFQRDNDTLSISSLKETSVGTPQLKLHTLTTGSLPSEASKENLNDQSTDTLVTGHMVSSPTEKQDPETLSNTCSGQLSRISVEEMSMVMKHYGLELREEGEKHQSIESYFGCARFWPWESIYYRRVKKGPISVENYARRVAQNQEFGIVDKYIRSSSGWGQENP
ncbi:hypothetical protein UlMin_044961 [Ulmus minor]